MFFPRRNIRHSPCLYILSNGKNWKQLNTVLSCVGFERSSVKVLEKSNSCWKVGFPELWRIDMFPNNLKLSRKQVGVEEESPDRRREYCGGKCCPLPCSEASHRCTLRYCTVYGVLFSFLLIIPTLHNVAHAPAAWESPRTLSEMWMIRPQASPIRSEPAFQKKSQVIHVYSRV